MAIAVVIASLLSVTAFAKTKSETLTLPFNLKFNGATLNKGVYKMKFDDKTNELQIANWKGKVVARGTVRLEKREQKAREFTLRSIGSGDDAELVSVTFGGAENDLVVGSAAARN
jgi:hypothetical protein